jgi:hypothetical protein
MSLWLYACLGWSWKDQMKRRDRCPLNRGSSARKLASEEAIRCFHLQHCHYCDIMQMCPCKKCEYFISASAAGLVLPLAYLLF